MRFTYLPEEETIIMSTNVKTKKYDMLREQSGVALLIHDFSEGDYGGNGAEGRADSLTGEYSITLNGTCSVVEDGTFLLPHLFIQTGLFMCTTTLTLLCCAQPSYPKNTGLPISRTTQTILRYVMCK